MIHGKYFGLGQNSFKKLTSGINYKFYSQNVNKLSFYKVSPNIASNEISLLNTKEPFIILHGLFGSKRNWQSVAQPLSNTSGRCVYALDLPGHGSSHHSNVPFTLREMARQVYQFIVSPTGLNLDKYMLIGHSLGGRVAMDIALNEESNAIPKGGLSKLILLDISPNLKLKPAIDVQFYFEAMKTVDFTSPTLNSRQSIDQYLLNELNVKDSDIRSFLISNLVRDPHNPKRFAWEFDLAHLEELISKSKITFNPEHPYEKPTLFLYASKSEYLEPGQDLPIIKQMFPNAKLVEIPNSRHWIHVDQPQDMMRQICLFTGDVKT